MKHGFKLITNGTDNHLIQIDMMKSRGIDGREAQITLDSVNLTTNCNSIANDPLPPFRPSGLRLGSPAVTTRGLIESDMNKIAAWINTAIDNKDNKAALSRLKNEIKDFSLQFPLPSDK
jgi:glycine hydroxymethyltransferase